MELWQPSCDHEGISWKTKTIALKKQNGTMEEFGSLMTCLHSHTKTRTIAFHMPQACFHRSLDKVSVKKKKFSQFCVR